MRILRTALAALALPLLATHCFALEPRTWIVMDGRIIEGELQKVSGSLVSILDNLGHQVQLDKSWLSIGDNEYVRENFPEAKAGGGGFVSSSAVALPQPAKTAKIDPKTFKLAAGTFALPTDSYDIMETPHFKVMYQKPVDPRDIGELAERLWLDAAFYHATFTQKFRSQKMAIFLAPTDSHYERIGAWVADLYRKAGQAENANRIAAAWPKTAAGPIRLTADVARDNGVIEHARVFRAVRPNPYTKKPEAQRGVWIPFHVHCLAEDLLDVQAGGVSSFGSKGWYAVNSGHAYYKEVFLTGKSETGIVRSQSASGNDVSTTGGFHDVRNWATELKKLVRKGDVKATMENLYLLTLESADAKGNVLAYAWARFLESSLPRLTAFSKLAERISTSNQMPEPEDLAKIFGYANAAALEVDFQKYVQSAEFH